MNNKEKVWKKLAKKDLILSDRTKEALNPSTMAAYSQPAIDMVKDLQEKLDDEYTLVDVHTVTDPNTFEPITTVKLRRTKPYTEEMENKKVR